MALLTPSASSSAVSGVGFWIVVWAMLFKLDKIPLVKYVFKRDKILRGINNNKVLSLASTEATNFAIHGLKSPLGVLMCLGGTIVNSLFIFLFNPILIKNMDKKVTQI